MTQNFTRHYHLNSRSSSLAKASKKFEKFLDPTKNDETFNPFFEPIRATGLSVRNYSQELANPHMDTRNTTNFDLLRKEMKDSSYIKDNKAYKVI